MAADRPARAGAQGPAPRSPRRWAAPETVIELAGEYGYDDLPTTDVGDLATWFNRGAKRNDLVLYLETFAHTVGVMQDRDAIERVAVRVRAGPRRRRRRVRRGPLRPRAEHREGLTLDEVMEAVLDGYRRGCAGTDLTIYAIVSAMRTAARSYEIAELAVRFRDAGVVGFDIAGAEAGYPPTRHLDAFQYIQRENFHTTIHAGEAFGLPSIWEALQFCGAERLGHGVRIVDDIDPAGGRHREARPARHVRPRPAHPARAVPDLQRQHRACADDRRPPDRHAAPPAVPGHAQHRQPVDERHVDDQGDGATRRSVRLGPRRLRMADGQRHEVSVRAVPRAPALDQRRDQAPLRDPAAPNTRSERPDRMAINTTLVDHPVVADALTRIRDRDTPNALFRQNLERIGTLLIAEATRSLPTVDGTVETPLTTAPGTTHRHPAGRRADPARRSRLRRCRPGAAAQRRHRLHRHGPQRRHPPARAVRQQAAGVVAGRPVIVVDPMLATGGSLIATIELLLERGAPEPITVVCALAAPEGIQALEDAGLSI